LKLSIEEARTEPGTVYDEPSKVCAKDGLLIVDGPDGVAVTVTPEAAVETSQRLLEKETEAAGQRRLKGTW
jgi:hypothetical protein